MGDLTANFSRAEVECKCGCGYGDIALGVLHRLQVVRDIVGKPVKILSACRCPAHNKKIGGKAASLHIIGGAIDFTIPADRSLLGKLDAMFESKWSGGWNYYNKNGFIHLDIGRKRRW